MSEFPLFDTHCHLDDEKFGSDFGEILKRFACQPSNKLIAVATGIDSAEKCLGISGQYSFVYPAAGIHPNSILENPQDALARLEGLLQAKKFYAVGEIGLDCFRDYTPFAVQVEFFQNQLDLARKFSLPVLIHCREAWEPFFRIMEPIREKYGPIPGVLHSFTGSMSDMKRCLGLGLHVSFAGMITFKKNSELREIAQHVPEDRLLAETDAPYLAPEPWRGKRNEPFYVHKTIECLAHARGLSRQGMAEILWKNACKLFGIG